jgi:hypothetical protein
MSYPRDLQYAISAKRDWDHKTERLQDCAGVHIVSIEDLGRIVQARTGRAHMLANGNIGRKLREGKRVYIGHLNGDGRCGILVQKVT